MFTNLLKGSRGTHNEIFLCFEGIAFTILYHSHGRKVQATNMVIAHSTTYKKAVR